MAESFGDATMWVLGIEPGSPARAASTYLLSQVSRLLIFIYMNICVSECHVCSGARGDKKKTLDPWIWSY